jgi:uncharacterized Zn-finger protein
MIDLEAIVHYIDLRIKKLQELEFDVRSTYRTRKYRSNKENSVLVTESTDFEALATETYSTKKTQQDPVTIVTPKCNITVRKPLTNSPKEIPVSSSDSSKRIRRSNTRYNSENFILDDPRMTVPKNKDSQVVKSEPSEVKVVTEVKKEEEEDPARKIQLKVRSMDQLLKVPTSPSSITTIHKEYTSDMPLMGETVPCTITVKLPKPENPALFCPVPVPKERKFFCDTCNKTFTKYYSLSRHKLLHTGERPFPCTKCNYRFIQRSDLDRHMTIHDVVKRFQCAVCQKRFRTKKNLKNHAILHIDALPFSCEPCVMRFRSNKMLRYHLTSCHSNIKHYCDYCGKEFAMKDYLKSHLKTHAMGGNCFLARTADEWDLHMRTVELRKIDKKIKKAQAEIKQECFF